MPPAPKRRIVLVHWNAGEAAERARRPRALGYTVPHRPPDGPGWLRELRERPADAVDGQLARSLRRRPAHPVVPGSVMAGYSGTPLPAKLGIKEGVSVLLLRGPSDVARTLGPPPEGVVFRRRAPADVTVWFVRAGRELERGIAARAAAVGRGGLWIAWPRKASGVVTDVTEPVVRRVGLAAGLVDDKVAAIDATWAGLRFRVRRR
jgi:hypothetical protein